MAELRCPVCGRVNYFDDEDHRSRQDCRDCGEELVPPVVDAVVGGVTASDVSPELAARGSTFGLLGLFLGGLVAYVAFFTLLVYPVVGLAAFGASIALFAGGQMARGDVRKTRTRETIVRGLWIIGVTCALVVVAAVLFVALLL